MKKFTFELEDLLSLRKFEQEQAQIELGKAVSEEVQIQDNLDSIAVQHSTAKKSLEGLTDFESIFNGQQYFSFLRSQEEKLLEDLANAKVVTEAKREIFKTAFQKTESLNKLKEKQKEIHQDLVNKEEEDMVDDIINSKYGN